jgi:uncharacterized membrane protein
MQGTLSPARDENTIEARVTIHRAVEEVFRFYRDFKNLPSFLGTLWPLSRSLRQRPDGRYKARWAFEQTGR